MGTQIKRVLTLATVLLLVLVAACVPTSGEIATPVPAAVPSPEEVTPPPTPEPIPASIPGPKPMPAAEYGTIEIRVTDPPPADVIHAFVTLDNIEVHREGGGWETIDIGENVTFDLMEVIGVTEVLGSVNVTAGSFTQIRMNVPTVDVVFSTDNGTDNVTARVPSEKLKIVKAFEVIGGMKTALTLDFDGKRSLVLPGKDIATGKQKAIFKPVVHLLVEHPVEQPTVTYQPDNWIRNDGGSWFGDDVYNLTGNNQTTSQSVADNITANYEIRIQNDGNTSDIFIVTGNATSGNWTVEYYDSLSVNITANVTGYGWLTDVLTSGNYTWISANITPSGLPGGSSFDVLVTSQSVGDSNQKDIVKASTNVTAS
jgi:hypothetical protein